MEKHLTYWWMFSLRLTGASMQIWKAYIHQRWKPIVAYARPPLSHAPVWLWDSLDGGGREKTLHPWQQDLFSARYLVEHLTNPNDLVCDPFVGAGTIPLACKLSGRRWIGTEIDPDRANVARKRLAEMED
jgi:DNA modification methylase